MVRLEGGEELLKITLNSTTLSSPHPPHSFHTLLSALYRSLSLSRCNLILTHTAICMHQGLSSLQRLCRKLETERIFQLNFKWSYLTDFFELYTQHCPFSFCGKKKQGQRQRQEEEQSLSPESDLPLWMFFIATPRILSHFVSCRPQIPIIPP